MSVTEHRSGVRHLSAEHAEYSGEVTSRHRGGTGHVSGRRLRFSYFGVASLWGFVVGVAGVLAALQSQGRVVLPTGASLSTYLGFGAIAAIGGGVVIAGAYQEAKRRR